MKQITYIIIGSILLANAASASPQAIKEAKDHLSYLIKQESSAKEVAAATDDAYHSIKSARKRTEKSVKILIKAYDDQLEAEADSIEAKRITDKNGAYLADNKHSSGSATYTLNTYLND